MLEIEISPVRLDVPPRPGVELTFHHPVAARHAAVLALRGEHDLSTTPEIAVALSRVTGDVLVDLSECTFIDSTVIGVLLRKAHEMTPAGSRLDLVVPATQVHVARTLEITGVDRLLTLHRQLPGEPSSGAAG